MTLKASISFVENEIKQWDYWKTNNKQSCRLDSMDMVSSCNYNKTEEAAGSSSVP